MTQAPHSEMVAAVRQLLGDSLGYLHSAALRVAVRLDVAEHLVDGPKSPQELGAAVGADAGHLHRLLRYLATRNVFREDDDGAFHLTPAANLLRADVAGSVRSMILFLTDEIYWLPAGRLEDTVRAGSTVFREIFGSALFDYFARNEEAAAVFNTGIADLSAIEQGGIVDSYEFPASAVVVDVGGGPGGFLRTILSRNPQCRGVLYEIESVLRQHVLDDPAVAGRWEVVEGDFFSTVPAGGDVYLLKRVLHDWDDADSLRILKACRSVIGDDARLLIVDAVVPTGNDPHPSKVYDLAMMTNFDGKERTAQQFDELVGAAGFSIQRIIPTAGTLSIVECVPV